MEIVDLRRIHMIATVYSTRNKDSPVSVQVPASGSYNSADRGLDPPTARTWPFGNSVAVWSNRGLASGPVGVHEFVAGSKISADPTETPVLGLTPPATSTLPLASRA